MLSINILSVRTNFFSIVQISGIPLRSRKSAQIQTFISNGGLASCLLERELRVPFLVLLFFRQLLVCFMSGNLLNIWRYNPSPAAARDKGNICRFLKVSQSGYSKEFCNITLEIWSHFDLKS